MLAKDLTPANFATFNVLERIASALSLCGTLFVFSTFVSSTSFQKPINRLVFYACLGNIMTNVATIMARMAVEHVKGNNFFTGLCQFQAVLIQMFLPADALWTFVMALNVYLTFFRKFSASQLLALEKWYFMACYGIPMIPALVFIGISNAEKGHMYGDAALWCWVSAKWDVFRIATFYGPVWVVILFTISIYIYAGREIYRKTQQLRDFRKGIENPVTVPANPWDSEPNRAVWVETETSVQSSEAPIDLDELAPAARHQVGAPAPAPAAKYSVNITAGSDNPSDAQQARDNGARFSYDEKAPARGARNSRSSAFLERISTSTPRTPTTGIPPNTPRSGRRDAAMESTSAMLSYTRIAVLFFIAMMITWIPSSANRFYSITHPGQVSLVLECFSAFVLPLQGFWNALIYASTTIPACRSLWKQIKQRRLDMSGIRNIVRGFPSEGENPLTPQTPQFPSHSLGGHKSLRSRYQQQETDSMTELKESRPQTGKSVVRGGNEAGDYANDRIEHVNSFDSVV